MHDRVDKDFLNLTWSLKEKGNVYLKSVVTYGPW